MHAHKIKKIEKIWWWAARHNLYRTTKIKKVVRCRKKIL